MNDMKQKLLRFASVAAMIVAIHAAEYEGQYIMFGSSPSGSTTTSTNTSPWAGQQPYLSQQYTSAQNLYNNPSDYPQFYPGASTGSEVAPLNATENTAITDAGNTAAGNNALSTAGNALSYYNNGNMLSAQNPYFQNMAQTVAAQEQPALTQSFNAGNDMNNPGAAFAVSQGLNNAIGNLAYQNYNTQSTNQLTAASDSSQNNLSQTYANQNALAAGQAGQTTAQNVINNAVSGYNYNQQLPYQMLDQYITQTSGNPGSSSTSSQPYYSNTAQNVAGLGLDAAAMFAMFSDRRVKENIVRVAVLANGLGVYLFNYIWSGKQQLGVMADEVEKLLPHAVTTGMFGFKMVNYAEIF